MPVSRQIIDGNPFTAKAARPFAGKGKWLTGFDLNKLSSGATECFDCIGADTIQLVNQEYATRRRQFKRHRLSWRKSAGSKRSLGWIPFKAANIKVKGKAVRFCGKSFRVFEPEWLEGKLRQGSFSQNALGEWYLNVAIEVTLQQVPAAAAAVGIDLGVKAIATTSDGEQLAAGTFYRGFEQKIAAAQRRGHRRQAKRLHRRAANLRNEPLHQFSRKLVNRYSQIIVGDVSPTKLAKTKMAKAVLDSGWGQLKAQLQYKGQWAGRHVEIVSERNTTRECSSCGRATGPSGLRDLVVREWTCIACETVHDRDVNAARNILALRYQRPLAGTRLAALKCQEHLEAA